MRQRLRRLAMGLALALSLAPSAAVGETCTVESFGDAVDASAAELRKFSADTQPRLKQKLQALRDAKQWPEADFESKGLNLVHDSKLDAFDAQAGELLSKIDTLGTPDSSDPHSNASCTNLAELKASSSELMSVMRAKSDYLISRIDSEIARAPATKPTEVSKVETTTRETEAARSASPPLSGESMAPTNEDALSPIRRPETPKKTDPPKTTEPPAAAVERAPAPTPPPPSAAAAPTARPPSATPPAPSAAEPVAPPPARTTPPPAAQARQPTEDAPPSGTESRQPKSKDETEPSSSWNTTTAQAVIPPPPAPYRDPPSDAHPPNYDAPPPGTPYSLPPGADEEGMVAPGDQAFDTEGGGYSIDEIREATRGFFGTVSTSLASVIEYAFQKSGRPTAYILGTEGGGAFLAGLRYGEGMLYLRSGGSQKVYWHGPSIGYDMGASGSRTLFLVYDLDDPANLFRRYTGVDGSAYLVGGVGMTVLKGGPVTMAPISSGIGLRLGASIGYLRFSPRPTWNPF